MAKLCRKLKWLVFFLGHSVVCLYLICFQHCFIVDSFDLPRLNLLIVYVKQMSALALIYCVLHPSFV